MANLPVPTQRTWTVGETVTDAWLNSQVRDAITFMLSPPVMIAKVYGPSALPNGQWHPLNIASNVQLDTYNGVAPYSATSNPNSSKYIAPVSGVYRITGNVQIQQTNSSFVGPFRSIRIQVNGGFVCAKLQVPALTGYSTDLNTSSDVYLNAGDFAEVAVYNGDNTSTYMVFDDLDGYGRVSMIWLHR